MPRRPLEIRFRLGSVPIRIDVGFWLLLIILGMTGQQVSPSIPAAPFLWVAAGLVTFLIHETAHLGAAFAFGMSPRLSLRAFGGVVQFERDGRRLAGAAVALCGPLASFLAAVAIYLLPAPEGSLLSLGLTQVFVFSAFWGAFNLLPILPLDAGHLLLVVASERAAALASACIAAAGAIACVALQARFGNALPLALVFALFAFRNFQAATILKQLDRSERFAGGWLEAGWASLAAGDHAAAIRAANGLLGIAPDAAARNQARDLWVWSLLAKGDHSVAERVLGRTEPPEAARALTRAMVAEARGAIETAIPLALTAVAVEPSETSARLAVRLLIQAGRPKEAENLARDFPWPRPTLRAFALAECEVALGDPADASAKLDERLREADAEGRGPKSPGEAAYDAASLFARAGARAEALAWLARSAAAGFAAAEPLVTDPDFARLAGDPEFQAILARLRARPSA